MQYTARLVAITTVSGVTEEIMPFVNFQAGQKGIELDDKMMVAILQIENIPSYHTVFLDTDMTMEELEKELGEHDTALNPMTKEALKKHLKPKT